MMHTVIVLLCVFDVPFWKRKPLIDEQPVIIVDLNDIKVSDTTNLPQKAEIGEEKKEATRKEKPNQEVAQKITPPQIEEKIEEPKPVPVVEEEIKSPSLIEEAPKFEEKKEEPKKESEKPKPEKKKPAPIPQKKPQVKKEKEKKLEPKKKETPKAQPKQNTQTKTNQKTVNNANSLKGLFSAVDDLKKQLGEEDRAAQIPNSQPVNNMGVEGGTTNGSYFSELSISNVDFVRTKIQECWNTVLGGGEDKNLEVLINVKLANNGDIISVNVVDKARYSRDNYFKAIADSAERAIRKAHLSYNVFNKLADANASRYNDWKEITFTFTPLGVSK
ncbi:MAG: hypothetical protein IKW58_03505 [Alphaproteobacteria bacterium]|nr:hypothetical protein [Alphaproteobacteria bacterium]